MKIKLSAPEWQLVLGFRIVDPDGWDRSTPENFLKDWETPITFAEFMDKAEESTLPDGVPSRQELHNIAVDNLI